MLIRAALMRAAKTHGLSMDAWLICRIPHRMRPDAFDLALQRPCTTFAHAELEAGVKTNHRGPVHRNPMALMAVMQTVVRLVSPQVRHDELMCKSGQAHEKKMELAREINHTLGNQLQIITSALRMERRNAIKAPEQINLDRIGSVVANL